MVGNTHGVNLDSVYFLGAVLHLILNQNFQMIIKNSQIKILWPVEL